MMQPAFFCLDVIKNQIGVVTVVLEKALKGSPFPYGYTVWEVLKAFYCALVEAGLLGW